MSPDPLPRLNLGDRPSRLDQARHATGELELESGVEVAWLDALEAERSRVDPFDFEVLRARAARLDERPLSRVSPGARWWSWLGTALAACLLLFALRPVEVAPPEDGLKGAGKGGFQPLPRPEAAPMMGGESLRGGAMADRDIATLGLVVRRGDRQLRGGRDTEVVDGDLLGFRAYAGPYERVVLVAVLGDGSVVPLEAERGFGGRPLHAGERGMLDFHVAATDPVPPAVVGFFGEWTEAQIRGTVSSAWASGGLDGLTSLSQANNIELLPLRKE